MAREGRTIGPRTPATWPVALILAFTILVVPLLASASGPFETGSTSTARTVEWTMVGPESLVLDDVSLVSNEAVLARQWAGFAWDDGNSFAVNGTADVTIAGVPDGLELLADRRTRLTDGSFDEGTAWSFEGAPSGQTAVSWDAGRREARFVHDSPASPEFRWDSLDSDANWLGVAFRGTSALSTNTTGPIEGTGMMQDNVTTEASPTAWSGAMRIGPFNWLAYDWLVLWISSPLLPLPGVTFNVTALTPSGLRETTAKPLGAGWQEHVVDLSELGPAREELSQVILRFNGPSLARAAFLLDDVRLVASKRFVEAAELRQVLDKGNATSPESGTAAFAYDWAVANASRIAEVESFVQVSGPAGTFASTRAAPVAGTWSPETLDVSAWIEPAGSYEVRLAVRFRVETPYASNGTVRLDNASLVYTERGNGTFLSSAVNLGARSDLERFSWLGATPSGTSVLVALRVGGSPTPGDGTWGKWDEWALPGTYDLPAGRTARYAQVRAILGTVDDRVTPLLSGVELAGTHNVPSGRVTTAAFTAIQGFVGWRRFDAGWNATPSGSIDFALSGGSGWASVESGADLQGWALGPTVIVRATLSTTDGLATPRLSWMRLTYEVGLEGALGRIIGDPVVLAVLASAALAYVGYAVLARRAYAVEDLFLVARDGRLILHNTNRLRADRDEDIFAGMLTAMSSFVKDAFKEERDGLQRFTVGGKQVLIERVSSVFLAAIYARRVPRWAEKDLRALAGDLHRQFGARLRDWSGSSEDLQGLRALTDRFIRKTRYRRWPFDRAA